MFVSTEREKACEYVHTHEEKRHSVKARSCLRATLRRVEDVPLHAYGTTT